MIPQTQLDAFQSLNKKEIKQDIVLKALTSYAGGLTLYELSKILEWPVNRITGRLNELVKQEKVKDSGNRRLNPESKKSNIVWIITKEIK